jgi:pyruvate/2-oxoglutarate dehydrogenase complex dihydrolipoamide dehydrogenase (E3) component
VAVAECCDVVVLGAGPAGEAVVRRLEGSGLDVVVVERELVGGECAYWACVPSKTLLRAPEVRAAARRVRGLSEPRQVWGEIARYRDLMISNLDDTDKAARLEQAGARLVRGAATIAGPGRVMVGGREFRCAHVVVATGTTAMIPPLDGLEGVDAWTSREVYVMAEPPRDAVVLGGGPVGVETAQMLRRHGSGVTIVLEDDRLLSREDTAVGEAVARQFTQEGIDVRLGSRAVSVEVASGRTRVRLEDGDVLETERLVLAVGRRPRVEGLGFEGVGIKLGDGGGIDVDSRCRAAENIWAVGDVTAVMPFTHVAHYQGEIAADDILGRGRKADYRAIPRVVFSDPEVAAVGLTHDQAADQGISIKEGSVDLATLPRTGTYGSGYRGFMTVLADSERDVLIGAWAVAPLASEFIGASVLAIKANVPIATLADTPMQFPTFGEALTYAVKDL